MTRPRVVAVVSAIASSTATFLLLNRLHLAGTLPGAMVVPLVGTLVGHWSNEGLSCVARMARRRLGKDEATESQTPPVVAVASGRSAAGRRVLGQWLLAGFAMTALAVSLYSLTVPGPMQTVVVKERVVEKTVTVTTQPAADDAQTQVAEVADVQAGATQTTAVQAGATQTTATQAGTTPSESTPVADGEPQGETADTTTSADASDADTGSGTTTTPTTETAAAVQEPVEEAAQTADDSLPVDLTVPAAGSDVPPSGS